MSTKQYRYLKPADVKGLESYEFAVKAMVEGYQAGRHRSKQRGSSTEFHEYRQYAPGDDPSLVDWRVFARSDRHYLKTFEEETNMECHVFLDSSASMGYRGTAELSKLEYASFFAACLSWLVIAKNDRVSLQIFDQEIRKHFPAGSTRQHLHEILTALENNQPGAETSLGEALRRAEPMIKRKGTLVVVSDFYDEPEAIFRGLSPYLHRGFRVYLAHVLSPDEAHLEGGGMARFQDMESGEKLTLHADTIRDAYAEEMQEHLRSLRRLASSRQVDYVQVTTESSYFELLDRLTTRNAR